MSNAHKTKQEIAQKRAKVAQLKEFIADNQLLAFQNTEAGFFAAASEVFGELSRSADKLWKLEQEIQQLSFDLERTQGEQVDFLLSPAAAVA